MEAALELTDEEVSRQIDGETGGPVMSLCSGGIFGRYVAELISADRALADGTLKRTDFGPKLSSKK